MLNNLVNVLLQQTLCFLKINKVINKINKLNSFIPLKSGESLSHTPTSIPLGEPSVHMIYSILDVDTFPDNDKYINTELVPPNDESEW